MHQPVISPHSFHVSSVDLDRNIFSSSLKGRDKQFNDDDVVADMTIDDECCD